MTKKLLVATRNPGKISEFSRMLSGMPFDVVGLEDLGIDLHVEETGSTVEENAVLKVRAYAEASGELTLADDSGLVVDALDGEPGVLSARYGGDRLDDKQRVQLVLDKMSAHILKFLHGIQHLNVKLHYQGTFRLLTYLH